MFELSLFDHLRLTFGHIVYRQKAHSMIAHSRVVSNRLLRGAEALLMLGVAFTSLSAAYGRGPVYVIASAIYVPIRQPPFRRVLTRTRRQRA